MTIITALYRDGKSSAETQVELHFSDQSLSFRLNSELKHYQLQQCVVSSRIGNVPRTLTLPDSSQLIVTDNNALDQVLQHSANNASHSKGFLHQLESKLSYIAIALVLTVSLAWAGAQYGVPWLAEKVAFRLNPNIENSIGNRVISSIHESEIFKESELDPATQQRLLAQFAPLTEQLHLTTHFLNSPAVGANAFALPAGHIIITDQLVQLAENDKQVLAVFAHEAGHVERKHGMRTALSSSILALAMMAISGDVSGLSGVIVTLPTLLIESGYSRNMEREADAFAVTWLRDNDIEPHHLADFLEKLSSGAGGDSNFLSTHPSTKERINTIK